MNHRNHRSMTHRFRKHSPSSIKLQRRSSNRRKHHKNETPTENSTTDQDYSDNNNNASTSRTNSYGSNEKNDDSSYVDQSDSINVADSSDHESFKRNSYINIAPLPIFHGNPNECPITHLNRFGKVCRANNARSIDMMIRIFPVTLEDEAALWYDLNIEPYPALTWREITSSFIEAYNKKIEQLRYELATINQGKEECVRSYFLRIQWILKKWGDHGILDNLLKGIFIDGLRVDIRDRIVLENPESLNEALRLAFSLEKGVGGAKEKDLIKCGFCDGEHEESSCEVKERMRNLWRISQIEDFVELTGECCGKHKVESENGQELGIVELKKNSSQCKCWKHQCWKKQTSVSMKSNSNAE